MAAVSATILANAIRALSMDAVQKAKSGHPGCPMGMADIAQSLWRHHLKHNPNNPAWPNRDRFVLSNGHGSMLLYSLLHLTGYDVTINDIQNFRQLGSKTPGHPEYGITPGVETTTGPLGQGLANAVGFALGEKILAATYNRDNFDIINHWTYAFLGDGCLMEGISHEVCSLAGTLKLGKLIAFWDDNGISIDGETKNWFTDNTPQRFEAYGWHVISDVDGHDGLAVSKAIDVAKTITDKPTLICCRTTIGYGAPNAQGRASSHGAPLGKDEIKLAREELAWPYPPFVIPEDIKQAWDATKTGQAQEDEWQKLWTAYTKAHPELASELQRRLDGELPQNWQANMAQIIQDTQINNTSLASRQSSQKVIEAITKELPELFGGSADLTGSNGTLAKHANIVGTDNFAASYLHYGVREFGMYAIMNGLSIYGGFIPFGGTFLTFIDYARNAIRMAALMKARSIYVLTHDSIGLGEDGPTHQPIEHLSMLRATPNVTVWRPCDGVETATAWQHAIQNKNGPTAMILSRQKLEHCQRDNKRVANIAKGGYILFENNSNPDIILISTGSEVSLCMKACDKLIAKGFGVRVVSMPSQEVFLAQSQSYRDTVLPPQILKLAVEAASALSWHRFVGTNGSVISIESFGESAPSEKIFEHFNLTVNHIIQHAECMLELIPA